MVQVQNTRIPFLPFAQLFSVQSRRGGGLSFVGIRPAIEFVVAAGGSVRRTVVIIAVR